MATENRRIAGLTPFGLSSNTWANNRIQGSNYDADGFVTSGFTRDAAGRTVQSDSEDTHAAYSFDGDGRSIKTALTHPGLHGITVTNTTYYLTSTVLGGLSVAELGVTGQRLKRYIYAGARKLAHEAGGNVTFSHQEPLIGSRGDSDTSGYFSPTAEFNADGINVGLQPPNADGYDIPEPVAPFGYAALGSSCSVGNPQCISCYLHADASEHGCSEIGALSQEMARAESRYQSIYLQGPNAAGFDPEFNRVIGTVTVTFEMGRPRSFITQHWTPTTKYKRNM